MIRVLFVCLGNICRSPTAQAVFLQRIKHRHLAHLIAADSAGTSDWHIGDVPDARAITAAAKRGIDISGLQARQVCVQDFDRFDYILAMDNENLKQLNKLKPNGYKGQLALFLDYAQEEATAEVPDPYFGGEAGFEQVLDLIAAASDGLIDHILQRHAL